MMPYKPKYCCQCGERIDEADQTFWTSRRFCGVCATEFGIHDRIPQVLGGIFLLFGLFGIGSYLQKPEKPLNVAPQQFAAVNAKTETTVPKTVAQVPNGGSVQQATPNNDSVSQLNAPVAPKPNLKTETAAAPSEPIEKVYFCGAPTKKGTMCSRRVKNGGRCWQHEGQEAMLPPEKLRAAR